MTKAPEGSRVGAILCTNDDGTVQFFGYGVYEGFHTPEADVLILGTPFAELAAEIGGDFATKYTNPRIKLDSGAYVYGAECWWGPEDKVKEALAKHKGTVLVDIVKIRADVANKKKTS